MRASRTTGAGTPRSTESGADLVAPSVALRLAEAAAWPAADTPRKPAAAASPLVLLARHALGVALRVVANVALFIAFFSCVTPIAVGRRVFRRAAFATGFDRSVATYREATEASSRALRERPLPVAREQMHELVEELLRQRKIWLLPLVALLAAAAKYHRPRRPARRLTIYTMF